MIIGFFFGLLTGIVFAMFVAILLFVFRKETTKATNWIKLNATDKGGFIESEQTLQDKHDEIWK